MLILVYVVLSAVHLCLSADLTYYVEEGKGPDTFIGDIAADSNVMDNIPLQDYNLIKFSILQQSGDGNFKLFKNTGKLYTARILDAEYLCKRNKECFEMVDVAVRKADSFMMVLEIKVVIEDVNDHHPTFPERQIDMQFEENDKKGTKNCIPNAIDNDIGIDNSQIDYELVRNMSEPFSLIVSKRIDGTSKLCIRLEDDLDRELKDSYHVRVIAKDRGNPPKQGILDINILVKDINDNSPVFSQNVYNVTVKNEPSEMSPIVSLSVRDLDSGKNGEVKFRFSSETSALSKKHFKLNEVTGQIFLKRKFTSRQELLHKLYIEARDGGRPPLSSIAMVLVNVIYRQNIAPTIDVNFVSPSVGNTATISEDIKVGSFIAYVKITDHNAGQNGEVNCELDHEKFRLLSLGTKKYKVVVKSKIDRETEDKYFISITCQDHGTPPQRSVSNFSVIILDINDVRPQFSDRIYKFFVRENQRPKFPVGQINATDTDLGPSGKLTYSMLTDNKQFLPFRISEDGLISTIISLDHEFQSEYNFQVFVRDNGIPPLDNAVNVIVEVNDENDNAPYFTFPTVNPFTLDVLYYPHETKNITILKASDKDSLENAFLKYEIIGGNKDKLFSINRYSGLISFTHEATAQDAGSYDLQLVVKDSGIPVLSATTNLTLILTVSNTTSKIFNSSRTKLNNRVHQYLLIVIVMVAVTLAVPITAGLSICCIRCNDHRRTPENGGLKFSRKQFNKQKDLIVHPHLLSAAWSEVPVVRATSSNASTMRKGSTLTLKKATDVIYQVNNHFLI